MIKLIKNAQTIFEETINSKIIMDPYESCCIMYNLKNDSIFATSLQILLTRLGMLFAKIDINKPSLDDSSKAIRYLCNKVVNAKEFESLFKKYKANISANQTKHTLVEIDIDTKGIVTTYNKLIEFIQFNYKFKALSKIIITKKINKQKNLLVQKKTTNQTNINVNINSLTKPNINSKINPYNTINNVKNNSLIGKTIHFGSYNNKPIEWIVLDKKGNNFLIITKKNIEKMPYVSFSKKNKTSNVIMWLNKNFYESCFNLKEKTKLTSANAKLFLLSKKEVSNYSDILKKYTLNINNDSKGDFWTSSTKNIPNLGLKRIVATYNCNFLALSETSYSAVRPCCWIKL